MEEAQCYGQFGELKDWWPKLLSPIRRSESKESEFAKSSLAILSAAQWAILESVRWMYAHCY